METKMLFVLYSWILLAVGTSLEPEPGPTTEDEIASELEPDFLNPGGSAVCPSNCRYYFAGASSNDSVVCQKQSSGVGTAEQNQRLGVACYPAYGCGRDMTTCVNREWKGQLQNFTDAALACGNLLSVTTENPWNCGTAEENRQPCIGNQNNNVGKWRKATANLDCGWGSTYGNTYPGFSGQGTPATVMFTGIDSDYKCCLKAMEFEGSPWDEGGAAIFFQQGRNLYGATGDYCRVDREKIIYGNLDSSSGRSIKYQDTRCGDSSFYYRHAAGAADAANLHTGGRCVLEGGFKRAPLTSGTNLPKGELPDGQELPNHACTTVADCATTLKFNTINDAEECCRMCSTLSWLSPHTPNKGGDASVYSNGTHINPCVAWQIVEGRCRIVRKAYFEEHNLGQSVLESIIDSDFQAPGNTNWVIPTRGCGTSMEACNYYSWIYYREFGLPANSTNNVSASYRKILKQNVSAGDAGINITFSVSSLPSRHNMRQDLKPTSVGAERTSTTMVGEALGGTDCGKIEVYDAAEALASSGEYEYFDEEQAMMPLCMSECITDGSAELQCNLANMTFGRRLSEGVETTKSFALSFTGSGSGYDQIDFTAQRTFRNQEVVDEKLEGSTTSGTLATTTQSGTSTALLQSSTVSLPISSFLTSTTSLQVLVESTKNINQSISMTSLDTFDSLEALTASYKAAIVSASNVEDSKVAVEIIKITVKVTLQFSITAPSLDVIKQAIAQASGVPASVITISIARRLDEHLRHSPDDRRLSTSYVAEIDASSASGDMFTKAKQIHSSLQNMSALEVALTEKAGITMTLSSTSLTFKIDTRASIQTNNSASTFEGSSFADAVGQAVGGIVTTQSVVEDATTVVSTTNGDLDEDSAFSSTCALVTYSMIVSTIVGNFQV